MAKDIDVKIVVDDKEAKQKIKGFSNEAKRSGKQTSSSFNEVAKSAAKATVAIAGLAAAMKGVKAGVSIAADFEKSMSKVNAIMQTSAKNFALLSQKARELGAATRFSAKEAADAFTEMGKLGLTTNEILASSQTVINLAIASGEDLANTSSIMAGALRQFRLDAEDANKVADVMAKTFTSTAVDINSLGEALKFAGPVAANTATSIEETSAAIGVLGNNMIQGSMAGTAMRRIMLELADSTSKASKVVQAMNPNAETLTEKLQALNDANLSVTQTTEAFGLIATTSAQILIENADAVGELNSKLGEAEGSVEDMAEKMDDNLHGATKRLTSAMSELAIVLFKDTGVISGLNRAVSSMAKFVTEISNGTKALLGLKPGIANLDLLITEQAKLRRNQIRLAEAEKVLQEATEKRYVLGIGRSKAIAEAEMEVAIAKQNVLEAEKSIAAIQSKRAATETPIEKAVKSGKTGQSSAVAQIFGGGEEKVAEKRKKAFAIAPQEELMTAAQMELDIIKQANDAAIVLAEERQARMKESLSASVDAAQILGSAIFQIGQNNADAEKKRQIESIRNSKKSTKEKEKAIEAIEKEAAEKDRKRAIGRAVMNGALGATKTIANLGFPAAIPGLIVTAAMTAANIAVIASQKFATGGVVQKEPGVPSTGDQHIVRVNPGERILTAEQSSRYERMLNGVGSGVVMGDTNLVINGNTDQNTVNDINVALTEHRERLRTDLQALTANGQLDFLPR